MEHGAEHAVERAREPHVDRDLGVDAEHVERERSYLLAEHVDAQLEVEHLPVDRGVLVVPVLVLDPVDLLHRVVRHQPLSSRAAPHLLDHGVQLTNGLRRGRAVHAPEFTAHVCWLRLRDGAGLGENLVRDCAVVPVVVRLRPRRHERRGHAKQLPVEFVVQFRDDRRRHLECALDVLAIPVETAACLRQLIGEFLPHQLDGASDVDGIVVVERATELVGDQLIEVATNVVDFDALFAERLLVVLAIRERVAVGALGDLAVAGLLRAVGDRRQDVRL